MSSAAYYPFQVSKFKITKISRNIGSKKNFERKNSAIKVNSFCALGKKNQSSPKFPSKLFFFLSRLHDTFKVNFPSRAKILRMRNDNDVTFVFMYSDQLLVFGIIFFSKRADMIEREAGTGEEKTQFSVCTPHFS